MRKKISTLLFVLIGILLFPSIANAELACEGVSYNIFRDNGGNAYPLHLNDNVSYGMYTYGVSGYERNVKAYCIDPLKRSGTGDSQCVHRVDPSSTANDGYRQFDIAVTKAYQMLVERGRNGVGVEDRVLGEVIFRWINNRYGLMSGSIGSTNNGGITTSGSDIRSIFYGGSVGDNYSSYEANFNRYWAHSSYGEAATAREIFREATRVAELGKSYEELVRDGDIWGDTYTVNSATQSTVGSNVEQIVINLSAGSSSAQNIYWDEFTGGCDNTGVICTTESVQPTGNGVQITINVTRQPGYNGQDYKVYVQSSIYDTRSSSSNMIIVTPKTGFRQNMLLVTDSTIQFLHGGSKVYIETTPGPGTGGGSCQIIGDQHYCSDGQPCSEPEYRKDCEDIDCTPIIDMPGDCNNFDVEDTATGIISDINEVSGNSCNPDVNQVKQCVLGHDDLTDTSYESTLELNNNPYCKVYCKEKYEFGVPTAQITRSGGYFTLSATISADRDCYVASNKGTDEGINTAQFKADLIAASHAIVDAYNEYKYYKDASKVQSTLDNDGCGYEGHCSATESVYTRSWSGTVYDYNGNAHSYGGENSFTQNEVTYNGSYTSGTTASCSSSGGSSSWTDPETGISYPGSSPTYTCKNGTAGTDLDTDTKMKDAIEDLEEAVDKLNQIILNYNNCSGAISNEELRSFTSVMTNVDVNPTSSDTTSWTNDMKFDPKVTYNYNQDYMERLTGEMKQTSSSGPSATTIMYCDGGIDNQYGCTGSSSSTLSGNLLGTEAVTVCAAVINDEGNFDYGCKNMNVRVSKADYVQKSKHAEASYAPDTEFSTYTQYGTIKFKHDPCSGNDCLWSNLPESALPVSLITQTGVFPFVINYENIGQDNTTGALGRLAGNQNSVLNAYNELPAGLRCTGSVGNDYLTQDAGYVCHYLTNCNDEEHCDFTCDDENNCEFTEIDCTDDHCTMTCENCIFDGETNNFSYRTITLNNLNPNERSLGFNWSNVKGQATQKAVEDDGETIYETPQYSYTLTPSNLSKIREYNNQAGSYTNAYIPDEYASRVGNTSLSCQTMSYNGEDIGLNYNCRSNFLELIEVSGNEFATESYRITSDSEEGTDAFESFSGCSNGYGNGECQYVGPSWRIKTREVS